MFIRLFLLLVVLLKSVDARGAGECTNLCNDLRFEVLTMEICKEARRTLPRPKVGDFCSIAMEQGFMDVCVPYCTGERPKNKIAQACRSAAVEMPRPTVRKWCEHGYRTAYDKATLDLSSHFREEKQPPVTKPEPVKETKIAEPEPVVHHEEPAVDQFADKPIIVTIPITLDDASIDLNIREGENPEDAVLSFCQKHVSDDVSSCIRELLPTVLDTVEESKSK